jgi:hypothetical protein
VWRARRFWKIRLALLLVSFAVIARYWVVGASFWVFAPALAFPIVVNLAFWQSDARAEERRKARLAAGA